MNIPFLNSRDVDSNSRGADQELEAAWTDILAKCIRKDVADLRRIADEVSEEHAEELRAVAERYEVMAETYESD